MGSNPKALKALAACHLVSSLLFYAIDNYQRCLMLETKSADRFVEVVNLSFNLGITIASCGMVFGLPLIGFITGATWKAQLLSFVVLNMSTLIILEGGHIVKKSEFDLAVVNHLYRAFQLDKEAGDGHSILNELSEDLSVFQHFIQVFQHYLSAKTLDKTLAGYEKQYKTNMARAFIYSMMWVDKSEILKIKENVKTCGV